MQETNPVIKPQSDFFNKLKSNDIALSVPQPGQWRYANKEAEQTLEQYKKSNPIHPSNTQNTIYILPYGNFTKEEQNIITLTAGYLTIFYQLKVYVRPTVPDNVVPDYARRTRADGAEQLLAPYFIDTLLRRNLPKDAVALMAMTQKDLYPKPEWNFVFGLASYHDRIGVCSIKRLHSNLSDSINFNHCLARLMGITSHEIGHMFGLHHCVTESCVMNGSNSLEEADTQPNRLCSKCLKKLYWNFRFNNKLRLTALQDYFYALHLQRDYALAKEDCDATK